jgi:rhamnogalacturonan endolyase
MAVADVDGDKAQEIIYGAATWDSNGAFLCATGFGHGDALHVSDLAPSRPGIEVFMPHEDKSKPIWDVHDAATCEVIAVAGTSGSDNGRGVAADVVASSPGAEFWSASDHALRSCTTGNSVGSDSSNMNFVIYWDGDLLRELEDGAMISKIGGGTLLSAAGCSSNNGTKSTPTLTADLLGDWREEIIWRESDNSALRLYTTTAVTRERIYTLMHDPQYRMQVSSEQTAYNQPPHPGFYLGDGMGTPPKPDIHVR